MCLATKTSFNFESLNDASAVIISINWITVVPSTLHGYEFHEETGLRFPQTTLNCFLSTFDKFV